MDLTNSFSRVAAGIKVYVGPSQKGVDFSGKFKSGLAIWALAPNSYINENGKPYWNLKDKFYFMAGARDLARKYNLTLIRNPKIESSDDGVLMLWKLKGEVPIDAPEYSAYGL